MEEVFYENLGLVNKEFREDYIESFKNVLDSGWFILGANVKNFETEFAKYLGVNYCVGVGNGLDALTLALKAFNFPADAEVIVPSNTYIATILAIIECGFKPVLVEPDIATYNIDPNLIEASVTKRTRAIIPVHLYGKACNMERIVDVATRHSLKIIEDCAQSHGSRYKNTVAGSFGDFGCFSFYPTKNLGSLGDAGAVTTDNEDLQNGVKLLRNYGSTIKYQNEVVGRNSRLDELQAGFLLIKLKRLGAINNHKQKLAQLYFKNLKKDFILPQQHPDYYDTFHIFAIRHPERDKLKKYLLNSDIKAEIHYPIPPHKQKAVQGILNGRNYPISEEIHSTILSLPISYAHSESDIYRTIAALNKF